MPAEMGIRFGAYFADWIIVLVGEILLFILSASIEKLLAFLGMDKTAILKAMPFIHYTAVTLLIAVPWLYSAILESSERQGTFGKTMADIAVVDKNGNRITFRRASLRYLCKLLSTAALFTGFIPAFFNSDKLTFHDWASGTRVIQKGKVTE